MDLRERLGRRLAVALLSGEWSPSALLSCANQVLGRSTARSQAVLIRELLDLHQTGYPPDRVWLIRFLLNSSRFDRISRRAMGAAKLPRPKQGPKQGLSNFSPDPKFTDIDIPRFTLPAELADWLEVTTDQLDWFADAKLQRSRTSNPILQHYSYAFAPKKDGPPRLIESPKPKLKAIQRRVLRGILDVIPIHDRAHGFVAGRSCLSSAQVHAGEALVVTVDLKDFFLSTPLRRVHGAFRSIGYPWSVARLLTGLCSTSAPQAIFAELPEAGRHDWSTRKAYESPHLPQGAPTSPALANLAAFRLDSRLHGLAKSFDANYTRYADDLTFSGGEAFARRIGRFLAAVEVIAKDEDYALNHRKTRIMRRGGRQRVTGLIVNDHLNVPRANYNVLKATLHNCMKHGPKVENRAGLRDFRAHLEGRVVWVENVNPTRGARLRRMFTDIQW